MKITGIVAEYNPFHKGHEYQLKKARELSNCHAIAVVMSGNFVQRGEPSIIDKFKRATTAIYGGADIVIELPMPFSCQNAEMFSLSALTELKKLNINNLSFGCENDDIKILKEIASAQLFNKNYSTMLKEEISKGISYPTAVSNAVIKILEKDISDNAQLKIEEIIKSPNNVLAIEYIKSAIKLNLSCEFIPVKRIGKGHNEMDLTGEFDSATAIRKSILSDNIIPSSLTDKSIEMLNEFYNEHQNYNSLNYYLNYIYYKALDLGVEGLNEIFEVSEGLNNKIYSNLFKFNNVDDFIMSLKSKRYTYSKLRRILLNLLLGITKENIQFFTDYPNINFNYVKVLAFNDVGRQIIKQLKNDGIKVIVRYSDYKKYNVSLHRFSLTDKTTNIYNLPLKIKKTDEEYTKNAVYINK